MVDQADRAVTEIIVKIEEMCLTPVDSMIALVTILGAMTYTLKLPLDVVQKSLANAYNCQCRICKRVKKKTREQSKTKVKR